MTHMPLAALLRRAIIEYSSTPAFKYGLVNRPPAIGAVPKGYTNYDPINGGIDGIRHGVLTYPHELSAEVVKQYELLPLSGKGGQPLEVPKWPAAVIRKATEAIATLNYIKGEGLDPGADEGIKEGFDKANATIKILKAYAAGKSHLNADRALEELGYVP